MGGYGHSRCREFILGGVTRHVIAKYPHRRIYGALKKQKETEELRMSLKRIRLELARCPLSPAATADAAMSSPRR